MDDLLIVSRRICRPCLVRFLHAGLRVRFAPTGPVDPAAHEVGTWLGMVLYVNKQTIVVIPKNENRAWLMGSGPRGRGTLVPWPGAVPNGFAALRSAFGARLQRAAELGTTEPIANMFAGSSFWNCCL